MGLGVGEAKIVNGDVSTALKIALMRAQRKITNSLYPEILISFKNQQVSCCQDYWSAIFVKFQSAYKSAKTPQIVNGVQTADTRPATKTAILERDVYDHIAVNTEKLATWTNDKKVWVLAGIKQDKLRQICAYFDPKSQTIACQIEQGLIKTK
ncbi:hypothetical protein [Helicobacter felis]|uniref:hypothetical protein n=1 Tax=Helicobacter felis TaxID=214 RepID=UPI000CEE2C00|nr:hypothetical protein [Helicobacter felis]